MGRKRNIFIREFFHFDVEKNECTCKTCGLKYQGSHVTNLKRHMVAKHLEMYREECEKFEDERDENICDKKNTLSVKLSAAEVINACVELVTKESQCFKLFDCNAFKTLTDQIFKGLNIPAINSSNIMNYVSDKYDTLKNTIKKVCKGRMISLKMDTATRHDRAVLGINIQIIKDYKIHIYTLAMKELTERHTAVYLKEELEKVLEEFEIKKNQIYTITTDNGRNMIKAIELFSSDINEVEENEEFLTIETDKHEQCVETLTENICCEQPNVLSVKCAAHTLQLAVKDFFSDNKIEIIVRARQIVKTLRTPTFRYSLQHLNLKKPRIDVPTRWNSTFDMLQRLLKYKDFCNENLKKPLALLEEEWILIEDIVKTLLPLNEATLQLQTTQLFFGDFYKLWLNLKLQLKIRNTNTAGVVLHCLEKRETQLLNNEAVNAALFLDPRLKRLLSSEQKTKTKRYLKKVAGQMISLIKQGEKALNEINMDATCTDNIAIPSTSSTSSLLEESIREMEVDSSSDDESEDNSCELQSVYNEIENYKEKRIDIDTELMNYWKEKKYAIPHVAKLATIVHAVPATQVSVERAFSALKVMLDDRRCKLSAQNLQKLMFVKLNAEFSY